MGTSGQKGTIFYILVNASAHRGLARAMALLELFRHTASRRHDATVAATDMLSVSRVADMGRRSEHQESRMAMHVVPLRLLGQSHGEQ